MNQYQLSLREEMSREALSLSQGLRDFTKQELKSMMTEFNPERKGKKWSKKFNGMLQRLQDAGDIVETNFRDGHQRFRYNF